MPLSAGTGRYNKGPPPLKGPSLWDRFLGYFDWTSDDAPEPDKAPAYPQLLPYLRKTYAEFDTRYKKIAARYKVEGRSTEELYKSPELLDLIRAFGYVPVD